MNIQHTTIVDEKRNDTTPGDLFICWSLHLRQSMSNESYGNKSMIVKIRKYRQRSQIKSVTKCCVNPSLK